MKRNIPAFLSGVLTAAVAGTIVGSALAVSGAVSFNKSPIQFNGLVISAAGEGYALPNGCVAPASITYTDEQGGGTTYLPVRRVSELMGVEIGWDPATGAVTVTGDTKPVDPEPDTTAKADDYADWTAEDEAAYQEFKGLWEITRNEKDFTQSHYLIDVKYVSSQPESILEEIFNTEEQIVHRYLCELNPDNLPCVFVSFYVDDRCIGSAYYSFGTISISST